MALMSKAVFLSKRAITHAQPIFQVYVGIFKPGVLAILAFKALVPKPIF